MAAWVAGCGRHVRLLGYRCSCRVWPRQPFRRYGLEQQAELVAARFLAHRGSTVAPAPSAELCPSPEQPPPSPRRSGLMTDVSKSEMSAERTEFAEDRTLLANERTFASWIRTGYAAIGVGLGFQALFYRLQPEWLPRAIATIFFLSAVLIFLASERRAAAVLDRLETHAVKTAGHRQMQVLAYLSTAACAALTMAVWRF